MNATINIEASATELPRRRLADWLWRPWYAKIWWTAIPVWWTGIAASTKVEFLAAFYESALAGFLNVLLFPMTALMVLGVGYAQHWLDRRPFYNDGSGNHPSEIYPDPFDDEWDNRQCGQPHPSVDMYDPMSGTLYVGNPTSVNNGANFIAS